MYPIKPNVEKNIIIIADTKPAIQSSIIIPQAQFKLSTSLIIPDLKISDILNKTIAKKLKKGEVPAAAVAINCSENSSITTSLGSLFLLFSIYNFVEEYPIAPTEIPKRKAILHPI